MARSPLFCFFWNGALFDTEIGSSKRSIRDRWRLSKARLFRRRKVGHANLLNVVASLTYNSEIERAARILHQMEISHASSKGAFGLDLGDGKGGMEMIDAPLIKQAEQTISLAKAAGLDIPVAAI